MSEGYISAYEWDNYCQIIYEKLRSSFSHMHWELGELYDQHPQDMILLLYYYKKWHYNKELFQETQREVVSRKYVIENMLVRGYGLNIDLARALHSMEKEELPIVNKKLGETFYRKLEMVQSMIYMPQENVNNYDSRYIITELCKKLNYNKEEHIPLSCHGDKKMNFNFYFEIRNYIPKSIHSAILQKMVLTLGETSKTIMKGTIGYENYYTPKYLKIIARRNLIDLFNEILSTDFYSLKINLNLLKRIHYLLYKNLDTPYTCKPGEFRSFDFDDKNGVTVEGGKLLTELLVLEGYLQRINWHTMDFYELIRGLSEIYHLIIAVHPFSDANGRVGKCFVNYIMLVKGMIPIIFNDEEEVLSLPRYGSSLLDIESYFENRINYSIDYYIREIKKLEKSKRLNIKIHDINFDSGFHFRRYEEDPVTIEVNFTAYIATGKIEEEYMEECRIVLPDEHSLHNIIIYCGLCTYEHTWEKEITVRTPVIEEFKSTKKEIRMFDVTFLFTLNNEELNYQFIEFSVVSPVTGHVFDNKGLNYCYHVNQG